MILVVGGTGRLGAKIVELLRLDTQIRVMTRDTGRIRRGRPGVELVHGDLHDRESVHQALQDVGAVVCTAHGGEGTGSAGPRGIEGQGLPRLIDAAAAAGVQHFVYVSTASARPDSPAEFFRLKAAVERYLADSDLPYSILRPTHLMETWSFLGEALVKRAKPMVLGTGRNPVSFVAADDVARVAATLARVGGQGYLVDLGGPQALTLTEVNDLLASAFGVTVRGRVQVPRAVLRLASVALRPFSELTSRQMMLSWLLDTQPQIVDSTDTWQRFEVTPTSWQDWLNRYGPTLATTWGATSLGATAGEVDQRILRRALEDWRLQTARFVRV
jgi:uncharacterized protein YbjT (DUF2867 family)